MLAVRNHGRLSKKGYEPTTSSCKMTTDTVNAWPPKVNSKFWMRPIGRIDRVSAIYSQKGHDSHLVMSSLEQVASLMTLTPDPPSIMQPDTWCPRIRIWTIGFCESIRGGPGVGAVMWTDGCVVSRAVKEWIVSFKRGSRCSNLCNGIKI